MTAVKLGIDVFLDGRLERVRGRRIGLLAHSASCDGNLEHLLGRLSREPGIRIGALFGPEHGLFGEAQDQAAVADATTGGGVPVFSLYGSDRESLSPPAGSLADLDALIVDLQDVGSRYYTFVYTMARCMERCAAEGVSVIVLDRPNPLGGVRTEGPVLEPGYESFVGMYPIPVRHGLTIGELALLFNGAFGIGCDLEVIPMEGWRRPMRQEDTGTPWVPPSPNMPTPDTARVYPGACLLEGANVSEGRGTTRPFEMAGAPWVDPDALARELRAHGLEGVRFRPCRFRPTFHKYEGRVCGGVQLHVTDPDAFRPFLAGLALVQTLLRTYPEHFGWRTEPYEFESDRPAFDLLAGNGALRPRLEEGASLESLEEGWRPGLERFEEMRRSVFLYP